MTVAVSIACVILDNQEVLNLHITTTACIWDNQHNKAIYNQSWRICHSPTPIRTDAGIWCWETREQITQLNPMQVFYSTILEHGSPTGWLDTEELENSQLPSPQGQLLLGEGEVHDIKGPPHRTKETRLQALCLWTFFPLLEIFLQQRHRCSSEFSAQQVSSGLSRKACGSHTTVRQP